MNQTLLPGPRSGAVDIPASKSQAHRLLICAALGQAPVTLRCRGISRDIAATIDCLNALGAGIHAEGEVLTVQPITNTPNGVCHLFCGADHNGAQNVKNIQHIRSSHFLFLFHGPPCGPIEIMVSHRRWLCKHFRRILSLL